MLIAFFKTLVSIEHCNNEDVIAPCDVCLDGLSSALPSTKNKNPLHSALQNSGRIRASEWQTGPVIFPPLQQKYFLSKASQGLVYCDSDPDSDEVHGLSDDLEGLSSLCSHLEALSCLLACVITRRERGLCWTGRSSEYLSSLASSMWRSSWSSSYRDGLAQITS